MNLTPRFLAFDTSTDTLSVAVGSGGMQALPLAEHGGPGGAQASAELIPTLQRLLAQAGWRLDQLDAIVFGRGPGAFTGVRTACAVAQGLAFGGRPGGIPVLPLDTLWAVAEAARFDLARAGAPAPTHIAAVMDARMDELYVARYANGAGGLVAQAAPVLCRPEDLHLVLPAEAGTVLAGNAQALYGARYAASLQALPHHHALPQAAALLRLAPQALALGLAVDAALAQPLYVRDKVAQTTAEREAARAGAPGAA